MMSTLSQLIDSSWIQALGWTLLHSLWQGLVCFGLLTVALRIIPTFYSGLRYAVSTGGLLLLFGMSVITFLHFYSIEQVSAAGESTIRFITPGREVASDFSVSALTHMAESLLQSSLPFVVIVWGIGAFAFSLRVVGGYWYIKNVSRNAIPVDAGWSARIQSLAQSLGVNQFISIAESPFVHAPLVIGYLKPVILIPVGMISGLSTDQLESVLIHELIHIRRGDYLVNIIQSVLEALFFFNPFVWVISAAIRREREHCCDDTVVKIQGKPLVYVHALATLEEVRLSRTALALSLADNKNQLLHRIKRIMERSVQNYSGRERFVPVVLLVVGLMCASWLTIQSRNEKNVPGNYYNIVAVVPDTVIKKNESTKESRPAVEKQGRTSITITNGSDGDDGGTFTYSFEGVPDIDPILMDIKAPEPPGFAMAFDMIAVPADFPDLIAPVAPNLPPTHFSHPPALRMDTIPDISNHSGDWEQFGHEFEKNFQEKFGDFYKEHQEELSEMLNDLEERFNGKTLEDMRGHAEELEMDEAEIAERIAMAQSKREEALNRQHERMEEMSRRHEAMGLQQREFERDHQKRMEAMEKRLHLLQEELKVQLVKDGYLKSTDKVNSVNISDDTMEVNGKKIKDQDVKKYRELMRKHESSAPGRHE